MKEHEYVLKPASGLPAARNELRGAGKEARSETAPLSSMAELFKREC